MTPCREWHGALSVGYGVKAYHGPNAYGTGWTYAHRWVVAQIDGWDAIDGKVVMHLCDNPRCFRYDHLRIGTPADNSADMAAKNRSSNGQKTCCPKGHEYDRVVVLRNGPRAGHTMRYCSICRNVRRRKVTL